MTTRIDLHGKSHLDARRIIEHHIDSLVVKGTPQVLKIVTGNSDAMRKLIDEIAKEYGLKPFSLINTEMIINI